MGPGNRMVTPPIYPKYTPKTFKCLLHFFQFFRAPTEKAVGPIFALKALNTSYDVFLRKEVPFGGEKNLFQNLTDLFETFEKFIMAPMGKF